MKPEINSIFTFDGLDATGKGSILEKFERDGVKVVSSPPDRLKPFRQSFDNDDLKSRFYFYALGNIWVDEQVLHPAVKNNNLVLVDRSFMTTLAAHELRGLSEEDLEKGFEMAKTCVKPSVCYIIHVDKEERRRRLLNRPYFDKIDEQNMAFEDTMEPAYLKWAERLGWNVEIFDNTHLTLDEAYNKLSEKILKK